VKSCEDVRKHKKLRQRSRGKGKRKKKRSTNSAGVKSEGGGARERFSWAAKA